MADIYTDKTKQEIERRLLVIEDAGKHAEGKLGDVLKAADELTSFVGWNALKQADKDFYKRLQKAYKKVVGLMAYVINDPKYIGTMSQAEFKLIADRFYKVNNYYIRYLH